MKELDGLPPAQGTDGLIRTGGAYRRQQGWRRQVTESEIQEAIRRFELDGGIIKMLSDETAPLRLMVGWERGAYETIESLVGGNYNDE
jgi:hypothetical protein